MNDDTSWWQALNSEAERWEAEFNQRKANQSKNGLPITPDLVKNEETTT